MVVYLDGVIGLNFLVDWMLLLGVNSLSGHSPGVGRAAAGAALGGSYAGACMLPGLSFLAGGLWRWLSLGLVSVTAFGLDRSAWTRGVLFVVLSMALGGLAISFDTGNFPGLVLCGAALLLLCRVGLPGKTGQKLVQVEAQWKGRTSSFLALVDTGNTLRDPVTGEQVLVASAKIAADLAGLSLEQLRDPVRTMQEASQTALRLIPFHAVGCDRGMLLALRCGVRVQGVHRQRLLAFAPEGFSGTEYQGLTGG